MTDILVIEDEGIIATQLREILSSEGYHTTVFFSGEDAIQFALRETPQLVIVDILLPGIDGYEVVRRLRDHPKCMHIPIIMLSAFNRPTDRTRALNLGVDGYLAKPYDEDELVAQVRRQLLRVQQSSLSPLTKLPGGLQLEHAIHFKVNSPEPWSILYLDLDNFKAYNDAYGFLAGNEMILLLGHMCKQVVYEYGNGEDFVGHVGGDDFVILTTPDRIQPLYEHILARYEQESGALYRLEDVKRGTISSIDRNGRPYQSPLVSLSVGAISNKMYIRCTAEEFSMLAAEAKRRAKRSPRNFFHIFLSRKFCYQEYPHSAHSVSPSYSTYFPASTSVHHNILSLVEEEAVAEFL